MTKKQLAEHLDKDPNIKLYFYSPDCKYCTELQPLIETTLGLHIVNTDMETDEISDMFEVEYLPALCIVKETDVGLDYDMYVGPDEIKEKLI